MNASDRPNTCKSRGSIRDSLLFLVATGARVSNAYAIYLYEGDNPKKFGLTPHNTARRHLLAFKYL